MEICEDAVESFLRGNFGRFERTLEKLDHIKTSNIRNLLNREEMELMQTEEMDFNERFRNDAAGSSALMGDDEEEEGEKAVTFKNQLLTGTFDNEMHREMML